MDLETAPREPAWCYVRQYIDPDMVQFAGRFAVYAAPKFVADHVANAMNLDSMTTRQRYRAVYVSMAYSDAIELLACERERAATVRP